MSAVKELVECIVKKLVDNPETVNVMETEGERTIIVEIKVDSNDLGKVIGKQGRTAKAIRTLISSVAAKTGKRAVLEIIE